VIDSHAHLQHEAFARDLPEVLRRAARAGIRRIVVPGWDLASSRAAAALAGERQGVHLGAAVGIHPHAAAGAGPEAWRELEELAAADGVVAVGETGLDFDRRLSPRETQLDALRRHLELALAAAKPLVLHCRSKPGERAAQDELLCELAAAGVGGPRWRERFGDRPPGVLHSFSGPPDHAARALELGLAISFSGLVFRTGEEASAEAARLVPAERLLVETDAPYLAPPGAPRRRNEPARVRATAAWLARARTTEAASLGRDLVRAFERLFGPVRRA
jgi:TatD DNase family protein